MHFPSWNNDFTKDHLFRSVWNPKDTVWFDIVIVIAIHFL